MTPILIGQTTPPPPILCVNVYFMSLDVYVLYAYVSVCSMCLTCSDELFICFSEYVYNLLRSAYDVQAFKRWYLRIWIAIEKEKEIVERCKN